MADKTKLQKFPVAMLHKENNPVSFEPWSQVRGDMALIECGGIPGGWRVGAEGMKTMEIENNISSESASRRGLTPSVCSEIPPPWHSLTGYVFRCPLTGNMVIREGEKERMLVVSEAQKLMRPTKPCAQSAYDSLAEKIHFPNTEVTCSSPESEAATKGKL